MAENSIGKCKCPVCDSLKADVRVSDKSQRVYIVCGACHIQLFTRSDISDRLVRDMIIAPVAPPMQEAANDPAPPADQPVPAPQLEPAAPKKKASAGFVFPWEG